MLRSDALVPPSTRRVGCDVHIFEKKKRGAEHPSWTSSFFKYATSDIPCFGLMEGLM